MTLRDLIHQRRSIRNFVDRPVPQEVIDDLLAAAASAPSGGNIQPLAIIVVREPERKAKLAELVGNQPWVKNAPVSLVFCIDYHRAGTWAEMFGVDFHGNDSLAFFLIAYADLICAAQTVTLLAEEHGLGSVYVGTIQSNILEARELLKTPERVLPLMILTLGYPKTTPTGIPKLRPAAMVHQEEYQLPAADEIRESFEEKYGAIADDLDRYLARVNVEVLEADRQADLGWAERVREKMQTLGVKSNAEYLFKLRYPTDVMVDSNQSIADAMTAAGFDLFRRK